MQLFNEKEASRRECFNRQQRTMNGLSLPAEKVMSYCSGQQPFDLVWSIVEPLTVSQSVICSAVRSGKMHVAGLSHVPYCLSQTG